MAYTKMDVVNKVLEKGIHYLTSDYKTRNKRRPSHSGIDMIGKGYACDYIVAIHKGKVIETGYGTSRGYYVVVDHGNNIVSYYYHMKKDSICVKKGQTVKVGDRLGYMGSTGDSTGAHLHITIKLFNVVVDPLPYLNGTKSFEKQLPDTGTYQIISPRYVRVGPGTEYRIKKVCELTTDGQLHCVNKKKTANAQYSKGTKFSALEMEFGKNGSVWSKTPSGYVCIQSATGVKYANKV